MALAHALERALSRVVKRAERHLLAEVSAQKIQQEPEMTASLVTAVQIFAEELRGVRIELKILSSSGRGSEESVRGADVEGTVFLDLGGEPIRKGFLAQSKLAGSAGMRLSDAAIVGRPTKGLVDDCRQMLTETPAAFVWVYGPQGTRVIDANLIESARRNSVGGEATYLPTSGLADFYLEVARCHVGDPAFSPTFDGDPAAARTPTRLELTLRRIVGRR